MTINFTFLLLVLLQKTTNETVEYKNVQRRVYDTLNVLSALDIVHKQSKYDLKYNPNNELIPEEDVSSKDAENVESVQTSSSSEKIKQASMATEEEVLNAESELQKQKRRIREKQKIMMELIKQQVSLKKLKQRNMDAEQQRHYENQNNSVQHLEGSFTDFKDPNEADDQKLPLPLLFVECPSGSRVKVSKD